MPLVTLPVHRVGLEAVAALYGYPKADRGDVARTALAAIEPANADAAEMLQPLVAFLTTSPLAECEELYVRTFELNPVCALEIGWQLYGEQYARGAFLVRARELMREVGLEENTELPDHLPNILRVLARLRAPSVTKLASKFTAPSVRGMVDKLADRPDNPYRGLLAATTKLIEGYFPEAELQTDDGSEVDGE